MLKMLRNAIQDSGDIVLPESIQIRDSVRLEVDVIFHSIILL